MKIRREKYVFILLLGTIFFSQFSFAQQESQYTQYIYNTMSINPAFTGARGRLSMIALYRNQWVGIEGAPQTLNISAHSPLGKEARVGVGAEFINDKTGPVNQHLIIGNFSYVIPFSNDFHFSFGIKTGLSNYNLDLEKLNIYDPQHVDLIKRDKMTPLVGAGVYFYGKQWYLGISSPNLLQTKHYDDMKVSTVKEKMHLYLIAGYKLEISDEFYLKPSSLIKAVSGAPLALDVSLNAVFLDKFILGAAYRNSAAVSAMTGFQINDFILVGYAYDYTTSELAKYNKGSHEVFVRFELAELRSASYTRGSGPSF